ncbi:PAS domain S-box protein [Methanonatronarchaeum sp. AMET-Sl]|uniref:PAS domain S-box protein n=1 Tax=Methanonatronarchaeum sp. AMET-Sl TaxID=3037654 RepID=UPI00244DBB39|nr:PAS domain S-box protein [Methanonatronarchaeum sp. AMET-Sl]WGI18096.1 PAS domain S-box protein [Methanonatronarchaeum sp. AMET-Sl]
MSVSVLFVDDDPGFLDLGSIFLEKKGCVDVTTVCCVDDALDLVDGSIDVVVSDYQMPEMDGLDFLKVLREERGLDLPFIMVTGQGREEVAIDALNLGADRYFQKGGDPNALFSLVAKAIEQEVDYLETDRALEKREQRFQKMLGLVPDFISIHDPDMNIVYSNWNGWGAVSEEKQVLGSKCYKTYRGFDDVCPDCRAIEVFETKEPIKKQVRLSDNEIIDLRVIPVLDEMGEVEFFVEWVRDITDIKETEIELRESRDRYQRLAEKAPVGILTCDKEGEIEYINDRLLEQLNSPDIDKTKEINLLDFSLLKKHGFSEVLENCLDSGETVDFEMEYTSKWGEKFWSKIYIAPFKDDGDITGAQIIVDDITELKETEKELKNQKNLLKGIIDGIPDILAIQDPDHTINRYNKAGYEKLDIEAGEAKGKKCYELLGREQECKECATKKAVNTGELEQIEKYVPELDLYLYCRSNPILNDDGEIEHVVEQLIDITDRKKQEKEIKENKKRLDTLISNTPAVIYSYIIKDGEQKITYVNEKVQEVLGYKPKEFIENRKLNQECIHPEDKEIFNSKIQKIKEKDSSIDEYRFRDKNGDYHWINNHQTVISRKNNVIKVVGAWWDITERKQIEEEKNLLLENIDHQIWYLKDPETYGKVNKAHAKFLNKGKKEIEHKPIHQLPLTKQEIKTCIESNKKVFNQKKTIQTKEWIKTKNKRKKLLSITKSPKIEDNEVKYVICSAEDITEQKKRKDWEKFLHNLLRHDVKNKNQIAQGYLNLIQEQEIPPKTKEHLKKAQNNLKESNKITEKIKSLQKARQEKPKPINLNKTLKKIQQQNPEIQTTIHNNLPNQTTINAGPLLNQVFTNIIENSIKHSNANKIKIKTKNQKTKITITIEDNGKGIPDQEKQKIFNKGYSKGKNKGTGLGLYLVKQIIKHYNGKITTKNSKMGGTRFDITLQKPKTQKTLSKK